MARILITGGSGVLGHALVAKLGKNSNYTLRVMSRRPQPADWRPDIEWAQADLETGAGLAEAVADVQTVIHAASSPFKHNREADIDGTRRLLEVAHAAGVSHAIYISIVGVDRVKFYYYSSKFAAENLFMQSDIPWSILRATQFHDLLDFTLQAVGRFPIMPLPTNLVFQPVSVDEVADVLCQCVAAGPSGRLPDMGGPEILHVSELARTWLQVRGLRRLVLPLPLPGEAARSLRDGYHTCPQNRQGKLTWREWVERKYAKESIASTQSTQGVYGGR